VVVGVQLAIAGGIVVERAQYEGAQTRADTDTPSEDPGQEQRNTTHGILARWVMPPPHFAVKTPAA